MISNAISILSASLNFKSSTSQIEKFYRGIRKRERSMIIRSITRCCRIRKVPSFQAPFQRMKQRTYSTSNSTATAPIPPSPASVLGAFTNECDKIAPKFEVHGSQIQILRTPSEFYETLKVGIYRHWTMEGRDEC